MMPAEPLIRRISGTSPDGSGQRTATSGERAADRVYTAVKASVVAFEFPQGKRIYLDPIASQLGVSTTPVREALIRLAAEGLVIKAPRKGFIAKTLSEERLLGQYEITRLLLCQGIESLDADTIQSLPTCEPVAGVLNRLNRRTVTDVKALAGCTGDLFAHIAGIISNPHVIRSITAANDRLFFVRMKECEHFDDVQQSLIYFCELLLSGECKALVSAIGAYHDRRTAHLPRLFDELYRQIS